jgi:NAD(P)-dependent dehydrogenase (short-subunit alcohol dehydrogenase family)
MGRLSGRRAFVTGSSSGIGAETARRLAAEGAAIILHGRNQERLALIEAELCSGGAEVTSIRGRLDDIATARDIASRALAIGPIDILVNNAGGPEGNTDQAGKSSEALNSSVSVQRPVGWFDTTPEDWLASYKNNVISTVALTQAIVPAMKARDWGRVISIGSAITDNSTSIVPDYRAAKNAVASFTISLAIALRGTNVTANTISPGVIVSERRREQLEASAEAKGWGSTWPEIERNASQELSPSLIPRLGRTLDIARAVVFLADDDGGFITGVNLRIDGGVVLA